MERPGSQDDRRLVQQFQAGSSGAFDHIYRAHYRRVSAVCGRYLRDPRDVEEAVQETFIKAYVALPRFNGVYQVRAWLVRIATNTAIDIGRRNHRRRDLVPLSSEEEERASNVVLEHDGIAFGPALSEALGRMPTEHARALALRAVHGASHSEVGAVLGKSPGQVKSLLHRARQSFRRIWQEVDSGLAS